jgi:hypothetical protein
MFNNAKKVFSLTPLNAQESFCSEIFASDDSPPKRIKTTLNKQSTFHLDIKERDSSMPIPGSAEPWY